MNEPAAAPLAPALGEVVADVCDSKLVFLGEEGSHGGASAFAVKAQLVEALIEKCNFRHVAFESQIYDFENLKQRYAARTATRAALFDAVGGLWSTSSEMDQFLATLHDQALSGRVVLSGIDGQVGSATGIYTQTKLGGLISEGLAEPGRQNCKHTIDTLTSWAFDTKHPYDDDFKAQIASCVEKAQLAANGLGSRDSARENLIKSFKDYLHFSEDDYFNQRDRLMYENLEVILNTLPAGTKTVVWTANVHAVRQPFIGNSSTASYMANIGNGSVKSIGIVAISGSYGRQGKAAITLEPAMQGSLELAAAPAAPSDMTYVSSTTMPKYDQLQSRLLGYSAYKQASWSQLFDGVIVLGREHQPNFIRSAQPQQIAE